MRYEILTFLCCPACRGGLELVAEELRALEVISGELRCRECRKGYRINYGLPNLVYPDPEELPEKDRKSIDHYDHAAVHHPCPPLWALPLVIWERCTRRRDVISPLELQLGHCVLEVGAGTGSNLMIIAKEIKKEGKLFALDLSPRTLAGAREKLKKSKIEAHFVVGNGGYLPYPDNMFDAVLHYGGIHAFGEKERAVREMVRVAKPAAKVVISDQGLAPGKRRLKWLLLDRKR